MSDARRALVAFRREFATAAKQAVACPVCGSNDRRIALVGDRHGLGLQIAVCRACTAGYVAVRPENAWFDHFYEEHYWRLYAGAWIEREAEESLDRCRQILDRHASHLPTAVARCLDVGSGTGGMLRACREKFDRAEVIGLDLSGDSVRMCRDRWGFQVEQIAADLQIPSAIGAGFDLITCIHVLEHLSRPADLVAQIPKLLSPGGVFILDVPDLLSPAWRGRDFFHIAHVNYFHEYPLRRLLERQGLRVVGVAHGAARQWPWAIGLASVRGNGPTEVGGEAPDVPAVCGQIARQARGTWTARASRLKGLLASIPIVGPALLAGKRLLRQITGTTSVPRR